MKNKYMEINRNKFKDQTLQDIEAEDKRKDELWKFKNQERYNNKKSSSTKTEGIKEINIVKQWQNHKSLLEGWGDL